jgi:hypothetical protein
MKAPLACLSLLLLTASAQGQPDYTEYAQSIHIAKGRTAREVVCILGSADIAGRVTGDVVAVGGDVTVSGLVEGDAVAAGGRVRLLPGGVVKGDAVAVGGTVENVSGTAVSSDSFRFFHLPGQRSFDPVGAGFLVGGNILVILLGGFALGPMRADRIVDRIRRRWWLHFPLGVALWGAYLVLEDAVEPASTFGEIIWWMVALSASACMLLGYLGLAWLVGRVVSRREGLWGWLAGGAALTALLLVPVAGAFVALLLVVITLGTGLEWCAVWLLKAARFRRRGRGSPSE